MSSSLPRNRISARPVLIALVAIAYSVPVCAQTVRGTVVDDRDRRPLESASISLPDVRNNAVHRGPVRSDSAGRFTIHQYDLRLSKGHGKFFDSLWV